MGHAAGGDPRRRGLGGRAGELPPLPGSGGSERRRRVHDPVLLRPAPGRHPDRLGGVDDGPLRRPQGAALLAEHHGRLRRRRDLPLPRDHRRPDPARRLLLLHLHRGLVPGLLLALPDRRHRGGRRGADRRAGGLRRRLLQHLHRPRGERRPHRRLDRDPGLLGRSPSGSTSGWSSAASRRGSRSSSAGRCRRWRSAP